MIQWHKNVCLCTRRDRRDFSLLVSLHVKNFAIIDEVEVLFKDHLNILTGETGAGKSIIIGSINAALGARVSRDILRTGAEYALIELVFETKDQNVIDKLRELGIVENGKQIIITRKIMPSTSIYRINGEAVTLAHVKEIGSMLIDIHGQHEHQSLLNKDKHLEIVDRFAKDEIANLKEELGMSYREYSTIKDEYDNVGIDDEKRNREIAFLEYEVNEIKAANLIIGEDIKLEERYKKLSNASNIIEGMEDVYQMTGYQDNSSGDLIGRAARQLSKLVQHDDSINNLLSQVRDIDSILNDFNREVSDYISNIDNNEEELSGVTKRLDQINHLKQKYGGSIDEIMAYCHECEEKLDKYRDYDTYLDKLKKSLDLAESKLKKISYRLSDIRKSKSKELTKKIQEALVSLNFLEVSFDMTFTEKSKYTSNGIDDAEFIISTNPGEELKPLSKVASGGELSRVMLGIKSVLADKDDIESLIFDEIDTGISGRTAQKVSEQLALIARHHQVICITHLAQIAAMADAHYIIEKETDGKSTQTTINKLNEEESIEELARILGGAVITDRVIESAREMKELAEDSKKYKL